MTSSIRIGLGLLAADLAATALLFSRLPAQVPVHWGFNGPDRYGSPLELALLGPGLLLVLVLLLAAVRRIDPLGSRPLASDAPPAERGAFETMNLSLIALGALAHVAALAHLGGLIHLGRWFGALMLPALLLVLGNFLPRVRPNYFAGLRTPWTLASETVWRRTNRLAGKLLFFGGLLCVPLAFAPMPVPGVAFLVVALGGALIPVVASYVWWRQEQR